MRQRFAGCIIDRFQERFTFIIVGDSFICTRVRSLRDEVTAIRCLRRTVYNCTIIAHRYTAESDTLVTPFLSESIYLKHVVSVFQRSLNAPRSIHFHNLTHTFSGRSCVTLWENTVHHTRSTRVSGYSSLFSRTCAISAPDTPSTSEIDIFGKKCETYTQITLL